MADEIDQVAKLIDADAWHDNLPEDGLGASWHARRASARERAAQIIPLIEKAAKAEMREAAAKRAQQRGEEYCQPTQSDYDKRDGCYDAAAAIRSMEV